MPRPSIACGRMAVAAIRADLREWLRRTSEDRSGFVPRHFELSFGLPASLRAPPMPIRRSVADAVELDCGIKLRGSIDLVERHPSGLLRVTDHKSGKFDGNAPPSHRWRQVRSSLSCTLSRQKSSSPEKAQSPRAAFISALQEALSPNRQSPLDARARRCSRASRECDQ